MKLRKWVKILHRDVGYLATGLTVIYAISGIAVNHIDEWNPNYVIERTLIQVDPYPDSTYSTDQLVKYVLSEVNETGEFKNYFRPDPNSINIFVDGNTLNVDLKNWEVEQEKVESRSIIRETNFLHLNNPKKVWTYVADLFAVALAFLAITGLFMIKGKNGIKGRGWWITTIGLLIPIVFLLIYYY